jgi:hypothetical protein
MAVQQLKVGKVFFQQDVNKKYEKKQPKEIRIEKPVEEKIEKNVYGEQKYTYMPESNGNLQLEQLMGRLMNKLDNIPGGESQTGIAPVEIDIKKEIYIDKVDTNKIESEEIKGKVNNKLSKLRALRKQNGS